MKYKKNLSKITTVSSFKLTWKTCSMNTQKCKNKSGSS